MSFDNITGTHTYPHANTHTHIDIHRTKEAKMLAGWRKEKSNVKTAEKDSEPEREEVDGIIIFVGA